MIKLKDILQESIVGDKIQCDNCNWNWKIADGGDDLYMCHKCDAHRATRSRCPKTRQKVCMTCKGRYISYAIA